MKRILLLYFILLNVIGFSQGTLRGSVRDENNEPLAGASILLQTEGATANALGNYEVTLKEGHYDIKISFIGYTTQLAAVNIRNNEITVLSSVLKPGGIQLADIVVNGEPDRPINTLSQIDIKLRPINTAQDILRMVPGLFIAQHAGGGKAEQIFLRGFDADHGTDINVEVDGLPVNMISHAHGQGYADLHFLIPELVNTVDFDKGPYFANKGDLNTAGYVSFQTKNKLDRNFVKLEGGSFGAARAVAGINLPLNRKRSSAYIASEYSRTDGYFDNPQKFQRFNLQARFNSQVNDHTMFTATATAFKSGWNASGQIPDRAVAEGMINRYGSIDPTEGGGTSRYNLLLKLKHDFNNGSSWENQAYAIRYDFNLYSNFTFYLKDSVNGDQINQKDGRWVYGYKSRYLHTSTFLRKILKTDVGGGFRYDVINNIALNHTVKRQFLNHIEYGDIREANVNAYVSETLCITDRLSANAAVRLDYFSFSYTDKLSMTQRSDVGKAIVNPKLNLTFQATNSLSLFARAGTGFHSNDARVVVAQAGTKTLPRAYGLDVGADVKITPRFFVHSALWRLDLDQEFVYVGDDGIVEPSGKTTREGIDLSMRYQLGNSIFLDGDLNVTKPRFKGLRDGENYIPLAPIITSIGGISYRKSSGLNGSLRYRYMGDRPANEDNTIIANGYFISDVMVNYSDPRFEIGISIENIFNTQWKEAQFATQSRLKNEKAPVEEIHFTPGTPFSLKIRFTKYF